MSRQLARAAGRFVPGLIFVGLLTFLLQLPGLSAQVTATPVAGTGKEVMGVNFSINEAEQHSSLTGWADIVTSDLSFRFNPHLAIGLSTPWFPTFSNYVKEKTNGVVTYPFETGKNLLGDTTFAGKYHQDLGDFDDDISGMIGLPTGNYKFGLTANKLTYNVTDHLEYSIGPFSPDIEVGEGNSTNLTHHAASKSYTAVGQIANFQAGTNIDFTHGVGLDLEGYEYMPLGNQIVYGTISKVGKNGKPKTKQILEGPGMAEDNGINAGLDIPFLRHYTLSASYERSFIQGTDILDLSVNWVMRVPRHAGKK